MSVTALDYKKIKSAFLRKKLMDPRKIFTTLKRDTSNSSGLRTRRLEAIPLSWSVWPMPGGTSSAPIDIAESAFTA